MDIRLTQSMEDYLETILELVQERKVARVKDIARIRGVKPGSVSPAMRRLADMGLIEYVQREFIDLSPEGEIVAKKVMARHQLLRHFFYDILQMEKTAADEQACLVEHCLSDDAVERLTRLVEYLKASAALDLSAIHEDGHQGEHTLADMIPGQEATVVLLRAQGELHHALIDMGLLPDSQIVLKRIVGNGSGYLIELQGFEIMLNREQATAVLISV